MTEEQLEKLKSKNTSISESMHKVVGMIGTKLDLNKLDKMFYQPWDSTTTKHSKVLDWSKSDHKTNLVVSYTKDSFFKTYPLNFNSDNYDPIKTWMMGGQIAAVNVQSTEDDFTLLNQVFFQFGKNKGYILKPQYLMEGKFNKIESPVLKVNIDFISGSMLQSLSNSQISEINISVYVYGSHEDDKYNEKHNFKTIKSKFINPNFENEKIEFNFYKPELSFIFVKIFNKSDMIGRGVIPIKGIMPGVRSLSLYSNACKLVNDARILCNVRLNKLEK